MKFEVYCSVTHDVDSESFVSHCHEFDIFSAGMTELEAMEAMRSAVTLYIQSAIENKKIDQVLDRAGLRVTRVRQETPSITPLRVVGDNIHAVPLEIPLYLLAAQNSRHHSYAN
ncbi:MAG: hypothetical protein ABJC09_12705 [Terriglobia bacterium]